MSHESRYVFTDEPDAGGERFSALAVLYDSATKGYIDALGIAGG